MIRHKPSYTPIDRSTINRGTESGIMTVVVLITIGIVIITLVYISRGLNAGYRYACDEKFYNYRCIEALTGAGYSYNFDDVKYVGYLNETKDFTLGNFGLHEYTVKNFNDQRGVTKRVTVYISSCYSDTDITGDGYVYLGSVQDY